MIYRYQDRYEVPTVESYTDVIFISTILKDCITKWNGRIINCIFK